MRANQVEEPNKNGNEEWDRFYDETYKAYYWYNRVTGESQWDEARPEETAQETDEEQQLIAKEEAPQLPSEMVSFRRFLYCNAVIVEQPLCCIEVVLRLSFLSGLAIVMVFYYLMIRQSLRGAVVMFRTIRQDFILTAAAGLTLLVPGMILYIYRNFNPQEDWNLAPLPTLMGKVDCRRFGAITLFGSGNLAKNVNESRAFPSEDIWEESIVCSPKEILSYSLRFCQERIRAE
jgi:hypothetical protein